MTQGLVDLIRDPLHLQLIPHSIEYLIFHLHVLKLDSLLLARIVSAESLICI
jgi:hypothetical protein